MYSYALLEYQTNGSDNTVAMIQKQYIYLITFTDEIGRVGNALAERGTITFVSHACMHLGVGSMCKHLI